MTGSVPRTAQAAMDSARAAVSRLDERRHPEDNAADLVEAWEAAQSALRVLAGVPLAGVPAHAGKELIHEARTRGVLTLDQAHALVEFCVAADRCRDTTYTPRSQDLAQARAGFVVLESVATVPQPAGAKAPAAPAPPAEAEAPAAAPASATPRWRRLRLSRRTVIGAIAAVIVLAVGIGGAIYWSQAGERALRRGTAAYRRGDMTTAAREFLAAAERMPRAALPHIYLARLAREANNPTTAVAELTKAIELEPTSALALREMGAHQLAMGDLEMARRFYVRALERDPRDTVAMGYLGCVLARLGRHEEAQRFLQRAGPGEWTACVAAPVLPGGMPPPSP
ncbi:MAG TPA: tetratricopeptide repeat protein [Gemmatimonadaceae bacterium]